MDTELLEAARGYFVHPFGGVIRIEVLDAMFSFWVDGRQAPPMVTRESPADVSGGFCLWRIDHGDLTQLFGRETGRLEQAFITGRLRISGDMAVMSRLEVPRG